MKQLSIDPSARVEGVLLISPPIFYDPRGEFVATYSTRDYVLHDAAGAPLQFVEDDLAVSRYSVLRGLHGDQQTWKLIQCVAGEAYFVAADLRPTSPTYLAWDAFVLTEANRHQVLVPAGCASGMQCLSSRCTIGYKQSQLYQQAQKQFTVRWDEPRLNIHWPIPNPILSERDRTAAFLA